MFATREQIIHELWNNMECMVLSDLLKSEERIPILSDIAAAVESFPVYARLPK
ncbi:hypothetical protein ASZ90_011265 [hydrocarbon metagenome]|uniref:Uncharacterized protein n=1 Tax=hydrocarbon metagenome TaxID=938273 RepID=A0A0W8FDQ0_9ZZZZ